MEYSTFLLQWMLHEESNQINFRSLFVFVSRIKGSRVNQTKSYICEIVVAQNELVTNMYQFDHLCIF